MFQPYYRQRKIIFASFILLSTNALNLEQAEILPFDSLQFMIYLNLFTNDKIEKLTSADKA